MNLLYLISVVSISHSTPTVLTSLKPLSSWHQEQRGRDLGGGGGGVGVEGVTNSGVSTSSHWMSRLSQGSANPLIQCLAGGCGAPTDQLAEPATLHWINTLTQLWSFSTPYRRWARVLHSIYSTHSLFSSKHPPTQNGQEQTYIPPTHSLIFTSLFLLKSTFLTFSLFCSLKETFFLLYSWFFSGRLTNTSHIVWGDIILCSRPSDFQALCLLSIPNQQEVTCVIICEKI